MPAFFSVVGFGSSGKTTLIQGLVEELQGRGYKIAVIKHDPRDHGTVDKQGSDTDLFWKAGCETVILSSPTRLALFRRTEKDLTLEELLPFCGEVDCIILEGYKNRPYPRVVLWSQREQPDLSGKTVLALVYKKEDEQMIRAHSRPRGIPLICRDDLTGLADLLVGLLGMDRRNKTGSAMPVDRRKAD